MTTRRHLGRREFLHRRDAASRFSVGTLRYLLANFDLIT
jgi:hypothetical protein